MISFAHIINPVRVNSSSDLYIAQPVTFESMRVSKEFSEKNNNINVRLLSAQFPEDQEIIPSYFEQTPHLDRSVLDIDNFKKERKLPILKDILDRLYDASPNSDYLIYTNVDIALMPNFYAAVKELIEQGFDAFTINRRTISNNYDSPDQLPLMYAEVGKPHPGTDCFVFNRDDYKAFKLDLACLGTLNIAPSLMINFIIKSKNYKKFRDLHLTFHIGDDRVWSSSDLEDYVLHNKNSVRRILEYYYNNGERMDHPLLEKYLKKFCEDIWLKDKSLLSKYNHKCYKILKNGYKRIFK